MTMNSSRRTRKLLLAGAALALAISAPVIRETTASASTSCVPAGASWQSSGRFATHSTQVNGLTAAVRNNEWDSSSPQTVWAGSNGAFGVCATQPGGVSPYPDEQVPVGAHLSRLTTVVSRYTQVVPSAGRWESAYDLWLDGGPGTPGAIEVMIWTDNHGESTGNPPAGVIFIDGISYDLSVNAGFRRITLQMQQPRLSATVHILDLLHRLTRDGRTDTLIQDDPLLTEIDWGWEISWTRGRVLSFTTTRYNVGIAYAASTGCG